MNSRTTRRRFVATASAAGLAAGLGACGRRPESRPPAEVTLKPIAHVLSPVEQHWVGDGFAVNTIFSPQRIDAQVLSPFILLDHAAPRRFDPSSTPRGVGEHPHRGFETVTFAYQGEVDHRDSHGGGGTIGAGDVQWMTAASGVVHEEKHSRRFSDTGGLFEMVQLWVNLPARLKMTTPRYQALQGASFPALAFGAASGRLIAGNLQGMSGPALTHTPITMFDLSLPAQSEATFELPPGHTTLALVLEGSAMAQGTRPVRAGDMVILDRDRPGVVTLAADAPTRMLVLGGEPLGEPVVAHGPFVMNTRQEINEAIHDFQEGRMGRLAPTT